MKKNGKKLLANVARSLMGTITHVATTDPVVALTFDDGPHPQFTPQLLDILQNHNARVTFFMLGEGASRYPELVRRIAQAGHVIGNHSWDHPRFPSIPGWERRRQIRLCEEAIAPYGQRLFRPPYGSQSVASRLDALALRYRVVAWSLGAEDYVGHDAEWMADQLLSKIRPGGIIVLHDAVFPPPPEERFADRKPMLEAVKILLTQLHGRYQFVTVTELLQRGRPVRQNWYWP